MSKTTLCASILLFCCPCPVRSAWSVDRLWIVFPFNTSDKDFQHLWQRFLTHVTKIFNTTPGTKIPFSAAHNRPVTIVNQPPGQPARIMISDWLMRKAEVWYSDFLTASSLLVLLILDWLLMKRTNIWYSDFVTTSSLLVRLSDGTSLTGNFPKTRSSLT